MDNEILVIGGGAQGLTMAAHLSLSGCKVNLWNRTAEHISKIIKTNTISCHGILTEKAKINKASDNIREVLSKNIMVTTPAFAHKDIAKLLAPFVDDSFFIVLNPGRTFGALEFKKVLMDYGCKKLPAIAETQTIIYTCRRDDKGDVILYALKNDVQIATISNTDIISRLPEVLKPYFLPNPSYMEVTLNNVGMILHCAPVLFNIGWIEIPNTNFKYYYEGITPTIANFLEAMDKERVALSNDLGFSIESVKDWIYRTYNIKGENLYEALKNNIYYKDIDAPKTLNHRYIYEDIPTGLVAIESVGRFIGKSTPNISLIIENANAVLKKNFRENGRDYSILIKYLN